MTKLLASGRKNTIKYAFTYAKINIYSEYTMSVKWITLKFWKFLRPKCSTCQKRVVGIVIRDNQKGLGKEQGTGEKCSAIIGQYKS